MFCVFQTCSLKNPNTGFEFNLLPLASENAYRTSANGKEFIVSARLFIHFPKKQGVLLRCYFI